MMSFTNHKLATCAAHTDQFNITNDEDNRGFSSLLNKQTDHLKVSLKLKRYKEKDTNGTYV